MPTAKTPHIGTLFNDNQPIRDVISLIDTFAQKSHYLCGVKLYPNLVQAVAEALQEIFGQGRYADRAIETRLKSNSRWGARDRAYIAETTYDIVRYWRMLWELSGSQPSLSDKALWRLIGIYHLSQGEDLPEISPWKELKFSALQDRYKHIQANPAIAASVPDWLIERLMAELGAERAHEELAALNQPADVILRANTLKINRESLQQVLGNAGIATRMVAESPDALALEKRSNVFASEAFKQGLFEVQDAGSQQIAPFLNVEPGMRVIDACAGAGGKTLHLAAMMRNKGKIIAMDVETPKLQELKRRAARAGVDTVETRLIEGAKDIKRLHDSADRLLLDVPCSGLGVVRRNPDAKWKLSPQAVDEVRQKQSDIIANYSKMLKKGGEMVYATCSILPSENEQQVATFLENHPEFSLEASQTLTPATFGYDGFYMARLKRNT